MEAARDHRVKLAGDPLLLKTPVGGTEHEVLYAGISSTPHGHRHRYAPHGRGQPCLVERRAQLGRHRVGIGRRLAPLKVEVDHAVRVGRIGCQHADRRDGLGQLRGLGERCDQLEAPAAERIIRCEQLPLLAPDRADLLERDDLVVAARQELEKRPVARLAPDPLPSSRISGSGLATRASMRSA